MIGGSAPSPFSSRGSEEPLLSVGEQPPPPDKKEDQAGEAEQ
jgi:hypothetical protein